MPKYRLGMCVTSRLLQAFTRPSFGFSPLWHIVSVAAMFSSVFVTERCKQAMQAWVNANLQGRTNLTLYVHSTKSQSLLLYLKSGLVTEQRDWQFEIAVERNSSVDNIGPCEKGTSLVHVGERLNPWHQQWGDLVVVLFSGSILLPWFGFSWPLRQNGHCKSNYYIHQLFCPEWNGFSRDDRTWGPTECSDDGENYHATSSDIWIPGRFRASLKPPSTDIACVFISINLSPVRVFACKCWGKQSSASRKDCVSPPFIIYNVSQDSFFNDVIAF